ncbi:hypothetical protein PWT90_01475 [Aphanocladium album]|nr:hypothetical protein PWT90_01475 [Aphanocladium album]
MLTIPPPEAQQAHTYTSQPPSSSFYTINTYPSLPSSNFDTNNMPHRLPDPASLVAGVPSSNHAFSLKLGSSSQPIMSDVTQALEIARESPAGASDPTVRKILDQAIMHIWNKVQAEPEDYVMTRDEFSVFNYFQHRFSGNKTAVAARARFWNNTKA